MLQQPSQLSLSQSQSQHVNVNYASPAGTPGAAGYPAATPMQQQPLQHQMTGAQFQQEREPSLYFLIIGEEDADGQEGQRPLTAVGGEHAT